MTEHAEALTRLEFISFSCVVAQITLVLASPAAETWYRVQIGFHVQRGPKFWGDPGGGRGVITVLRRATN
jgi:hypothetical protein